MKKWIITGAIFFLLSNTGFGQVEGDVMDEKEKAIITAIIIAKDSTGKPVDTVMTDKRGFYFFKGLEPGNYKIEAKAPGFLPATHTILVRPKPADSNEGDDTYYAETLDIILRRPKAGQ